MDSGNDGARMVFRFTDMDKENASKIVEYLKLLGDETAIEGEGYNTYGSPIPESAARAPSAGSARQEVVLETHSIEMDGKFLYNILFSEMQVLIGWMADYNDPIIKEYQLASRSVIENMIIEEASIAKPNKHALFQPNNNSEKNIELNTDHFGIK